MMNGRPDFYFWVLATKNAKWSFFTKPQPVHLRDGMPQVWTAGPISIKNCLGFPMRVEPFAYFLVSMPAWYCFLIAIGLSPYPKGLALALCWTGTCRLVSAEQMSARVKRKWSLQLDCGPTETKIIICGCLISRLVSKSLRSCSIGTSEERSRLSRW